MQQLDANSIYLEIIAFKALTIGYRRHKRSRNAWYDERMEIGQALLRLLQARNCPISHFAREVGMTRAQLYRILHDRHSPTLFTLERIGRALDLSVSEFLGMVEMVNQESDQRR